MRISTNPTDAAFVDARPRRVWCNEVEVPDWAVADDFRRCVITNDGRVLHGSVRIEQLPAEGDVLTGDGSGEALPPIDSGFVGVFVHTPDPKPAAVEGEGLAPAPAPAPVPQSESRGAKRRR